MEEGGGGTVNIGQEETSQQPEMREGNFMFSSCFCLYVSSVSCDQVLYLVI